MSRNGNCLDNAPMESFFGTLKIEMLHYTRFRTRREARTAIFEYFEIFIFFGIANATPVSLEMPLVWQ